MLSVHVRLRHIPAQRRRPSSGGGRSCEPAIAADHGGRQPRAAHPRLVAYALAATLLTMLVLIGVKVADRPMYRARTGAAVRTCLRHQPATGSGLPSMPHLAGCLARHQVPRDDPLEAVAGAALTVLAVLEIRYLSRHRRPTPSPTRTSR